MAMDFRNERLSVKSPYDLKLLHKALILVLVPLAFEFMFVGILAHLVLQSETETTREANAKEVLARRHILIQEMVVACAAAAKLTSTGTDQDRSKHAIQIIDEQFAKLKMLLKNNPRASAILAQARSTTDLGFGYLRESARLSIQGDHLAAAEYLKRIRGLSETLFDRMDAIALEYRIIAEAMPAEQKKRRHSIMIALAAGLLLSVMLAIWLARFFNSTTTKRLETLLENTVILQQGGKLNAIQAGCDEIAILDERFHHMAAAIREAETELRASEARLRSVIEQMPVGLITLDQDGVIESLNRRAENIFDCISSEASGRPFRTFLEYTEPIGSDVEQLPLFPAEKVLEMPGKTMTGKEFHMELQSNSFMRESNPGFLISVQDITQRRDMENLKSQFLHMISHDLRTPLTSLNLTLKLLARGAYGKLSIEGVKRLEAMDQNCARLISLINSLLDMAKMEAGKIHIERQLLVAEEVVGQSVQAVEQLANQKSITIDVCLDQDPKIFADETRLIQVLINLLSNAIKFSPEGSTIKVSVANKIEATEIRVTDQGPGIPADQKSLIFEKFHQVSSKNTSSVVVGTGLGLAICKAIVEEHGGTIGVECVEGKGSVFWFSLPRIEQDG